MSSGSKENDNTKYRLGVAGIPEESLNLMSTTSGSEFTFHLRPDSAQCADVDDVLSIRSGGGGRHSSRSPGRHAPRSPRLGSRSPLPERHRRNCRGSTLGLSSIAGSYVTSMPAVASFYRSLPSNEIELKQKIQALEDTVAEYEQQKDHVMGAFKSFREGLADKERELEAEYTTKIMSLSEEVLTAKRDFEHRMKEYQSAQEQYEKEKEKALEQLRIEHQKEIDVLQKRCSESHLVPDLERKYIIEIQRLEEERKTLKSEKERLSEAFEAKLKRAQTLYETELASAKALYKNELSALKDHEAALREELNGRQEEFRDRLEVLQQQYTQSHGELQKCKKEVGELEERLRLKELEVEEISQQLKIARSETDDATEQLRLSTAKYDDMQARQLEQEEQLHRKSELINSLESAKVKMENLIRDLQGELKQLKDKVEFLEVERSNLESQSDSHAEYQQSQMEALEQVVSNMNSERSKMKMQIEEQLDAEKLQAADRLYRLEKDYKDRLTELENQHKHYKQQMEAKLGQEKESLMKQLDLEYRGQLESLRRDKECLQAQVDNLKDEISARLQDQRIDENEEETSKGTTADSRYNEAQEQIRALESATANLKIELQDSNDAIERYQDTVQDLKERLENESAHNVSAEKTREKIRKDLEEEWEEKIRQQLAAARKESRELVEHEFEAKISQLESTKEDAIAEQKSETQRVKEQLQAEITKLREELDEATQQDLELSSQDIYKHDTEDKRYGELMKTIEDLNRTITSLKNDIVELEAKQQQPLADKRQLDSGEESDDEGEKPKERRKSRTALEEKLKRKDEAWQEINDELCTVKMELGQKVEAQTLQIEELMNKLADQERQIDEAETAESRLTEKPEAEEVCTKSMQKVPTMVDRSEDPIEETGETFVEQTEEEQEKRQQELENQLAEKDEKVRSIGEEMEQVAADLDKVTRELESRQQDLQDVHTKTRQYVRMRERTMANAHQREIERLKVQYEQTLRRYAVSEDDLTNEIENLQGRLNEIASDRDSISHAGSDIVSEPEGELSQRLETMSKQLDDKDNFVKQLQDEKRALESELKTAKQQISARRESAASTVSSAMGSMDNLKKRDSVSSSASSGDQQRIAGGFASVKKGANMAIVNKWQCLVKKVQEENNSGRKTVTPTPHKTCPRAQHARERSPNPNATPRRSITASTSSVAAAVRDTEERIAGQRESRRDNNLRLPTDQRRNSAKSPSRSPILKPKSQSSEKRPIWRV